MDEKQKRIPFKSTDTLSQWQDATPKGEPFFRVPSTPASNAMMDVLSAGYDGLTYIEGKHSTIKERKELISHGTNIELMQSGNKRSISFSSKKQSTTIQISDVDKLIGSNKPAKKIFLYILMLINQQAINEDMISRHYVTFATKDIIRAGLYKAPQSANKGVETAMDILTSMKVKGEIRNGKKQVGQKMLRVPFTGYDHKQGGFVIYLNEDINWDLFTAYFTIMPNYIFSLNGNKSFDLAYYIFYLARQNLQNIANKGSFNISLKSIHAKMELPDVESSKNPKRDIVDVIIKSVQEINQKEQEQTPPIAKTYKSVQNMGKLTTTYKDGIPALKLSIKPNPDKTTAKEWIEKGYIEVKLSGGYATNFIALQERNSALAERTIKRQQKIAIEAQAKRLAQKEAGKEQ